MVGRSQGPVRLRFDANPGTGHGDAGCRRPRRCGNSREKTPRPETCYSVVNEDAERVMRSMLEIMVRGTPDM